LRVFIILFDIYWLLKSVYLSLHLRNTFSRVKANLKTDWFTRLKTEKAGEWEEVWHLIILPFYREPYEVIRESLESILRANYPKDKLIVVLAAEGRGGEEAKAAAEKARREFGDKFFKFEVTVHPAGLPGEMPGKGSNETWAAKQVKERIIDPLKIPYAKILVSVFDVDTQVFPEYFGRLTYVFLSVPNRLRAIYQPIPLFTNNIYQAPALARVVSFSTTFWQMMQQSRPERLTSFSSQAIPFQAVLDIGFWQRDIVSEDSRIFWQGYLRYHGDFRVEPLFYPVSMDANSAPGFWQTMKNLYRQQRRWGWGAENVAYLLDGFRRNPKIPARKKWYWGFNVLEGYHSWATNSLMIFALGWLPLILGGKDFGATLLSYSLPSITRFIINLSMVGIASSAIIGILLLPPKPGGLRPGHYLLYLLQWLLLPLTLIVFGALPAIDAQTRLMLGGRWRLGFWVTPKWRYPETRLRGGDLV
jgi:cellulose synthase/poly-beta-1,6-N-acetylglucosamine synthase-like glycosyltransferase